MVEGTATRVNGDARYSTANIVLHDVTANSVEIDARGAVRLLGNLTTSTSALDIDATSLVRVDGDINSATTVDVNVSNGNIVQIGDIRSDVALDNGEASINLVAQGSIEMDAQSTTQAPGPIALTAETGDINVAQIVSATEGGSVTLQAVNGQVIDNNDSTEVDVVNITSDRLIIETGFRRR